MKKLILFFTLAILLLASCHSTKKGVKDQDKKKPDTTVITTQPSTKTGEQDADKGKALTADGTNFTSKVKVTITQDGKKISTNGNLRMRYNDVIQITLVDPLLGIAEVGRMELSPNRVLVIDRINRRYADTNYDEFSALKSRNIDYRSIQDFFWKEAQGGNQFSYDIPAKKDIHLDLSLSGKGASSNWEAHTSVSDKYTKVDADQLFNGMIAR